MNYKIKILIIFCAFIVSNLLVYNYIKAKNTVILSLQDSALKSITIQEVNPSVVKKITNILLAEPEKTTTELLSLLNNLTRTKTISIHNNNDEFPLVSFNYFFFAFSLLTAISLVFVREKKYEKKISNPLFMQSLSEVEYPVVLVNSSLRIVWQNQKSSMITYSALKMEEIFDEALDGSEIIIDSKTYSVLITEMNFKSTKHYLAHLIPKISATKPEAPKSDHSSTFVVND
jgi:hypothetical protein